VKNVQVVGYQPSLQALWDAFVDVSKNGTFLFKRDYVEYHADRFVDASLLVLDEKERPVALLPASRSDTVITSHGGLTYGGLVVDSGMTLPLMLETIDAVIAHFRARDVLRLVYRPVPAPYHRYPTGEDLVALFLAGATLTRRSALAVVDQRDRLPFQERRRRGVRRAIAAAVRIIASADLPAYWELLSSTLLEAHGAKPVHTLEEIARLQASFPRNIKLYCALRNDRLVAGVLVYESELVARAQYIAAGPEGKDVGALDLLFHTLLTETFASKRYFDFGTSERNQPTVLQRGLLEQKEGFGARVVAQDQYEINLAHWETGKLRQVLT
jgi:hypothetical protein